jgi:hypothetical protein
LKPPFPTLIATAAVLTVAVTVAALAQAPDPPQRSAGSPPPAHAFPAPTNLKVLPKNLTGEQVHEIMEKWKIALGTHCNTCHAEDKKNPAPDGRPQLNYADDTKAEKSTARLMYKMVEDINGNYVSMVENSGVPVTCGTCHRGHITPEPFVAPAGNYQNNGPPPAKDGEAPKLPR